MRVWTRYSPCAAATSSTSTTAASMRAFASSTFAMNRWPRTRQTGKLGCVVTTAGPGCTNAVTGIATAFRSESAVLHIGGQGATTQHKMGSLQDLPHVELMTPITKFAATVSSTERVADMISMAP